MGGLVPSTVSDQEHSQGGRAIIDVAVSVVQGFGAHNYYIGFNSDYFLDSFFSWVAIVHDYYSHGVNIIPTFCYHHYFELVKDHRAQWDLGGSWLHRLVVKPDFKEGGILGAR
ncbi:hypothetical protein D1007_12067 [Hordeum vulgare]|nr:hypothetical protein D1007_12067 [Hordeum vulgare]